MKSSLGRLRKFSLHKGDVKEKREYQAPAHLDELAKAAQDMQNMRNCYDSLLAAAAETANSAHEFSESLQEMGVCLLEKTAVNDDERSGGVLSMLGKVQFELQKLVDRYRSHIFLTITSPSESLLNELRTVEEMKRQCDEKRGVYEYMMAQQRDRGRSKSAKGESFTAQQLQTAHNEYDDEATLCVFRLKSLKQGQSRSLLTQAVRHHAAQLNFFRKGLKSLEAVEPHVRMLTEQHHIDYHFNGLEDDDREVAQCSIEHDLDSNDDGELSFDYRENKQGPDMGITSRNSMELERLDISFAQASNVEGAEVNLDKCHGELQVYGREPRVGSHSAPIFAEKKNDPVERLKQLQPLSERKFHAYVLPTPVGAKNSTPARTSSPVPPTRPTSHTGHTHNLWHSSPLEPNRHEKDSGDENFSGPAILKGRSAVKDGNGKNTFTRLPPPLSECLQNPQDDMRNVSGSKKIKRQAFSSPLTSNSLPINPILSSCGPIASTELPKIVSGLPSRVAIRHSSSPKISPSASPPPVSSPRTSELHELPRPPTISTTKMEKSFVSTGHSAPLAYKNQEPSTASKLSRDLSNAASPLPTPPVSVQRSFSIPSRSDRATTLQVARLLKSPQIPHKSQEAASPPLTPIFLKDMKPESAIPEVASSSSPIRGNWGITFVTVSY